MHSSKIFLRREADAAADVPRTLAARALSADQPGRASGKRSSIKLARFKIDFVNRFIRVNAVPNLIEFGCGAGRVMRQLRVGAYIGVEASETAMSQARGVAGDDRSRAIYRSLPAGMGAAMTLSMDSINRLTGDLEFNLFVRTMFQAARDYVVIYAADKAPAWAASDSMRNRLSLHARRFFPGWELVAQLPSPYGGAAEGGAGGALGSGAAGPADFFVYARCGSACVVPLMMPL